MEWMHMFRYGKVWLETKLRTVFMGFRTAEDKRSDNRFIIRLGGGPDAELVDFEVGLLGFGILAHRMREWPEKQAWEDTYGKE